MNKRIRKKKRVGEFQELGVEITVTFADGVDHEAFLDEFLRDAIERRAMQFGGGCNEEALQGFVELGRRPQAPKNLEFVRQWLAAHAAVASSSVGEPVDAWV